MHKTLNLIKTVLRLNLLLIVMILFSMYEFKTDILIELKC